MKTPVRLIYTSRCASMDAAALAALHAQAERNNAREDITGILIAIEGRFVQALEGPREAVTRCFLRIAQDTRHQDCVLLSFDALSRRFWPDFAMRLVALTPGNAERLSKLLAEMDDSADPYRAERVTALLEQLTVRGAPVGRAIAVEQA